MWVNRLIEWLMPAGVNQIYAWLHGGGEGWQPYINRWGGESAIEITDDSPISLPLF